jgi:predicted MFS family arabinose efflux permease
LVVLVCGAVALAVALGTRQTFGLFLVPISHDLGWSLSALATGFALQQIFWGIGQPLAGALADTHGPRPVIAAGGMALAAGLLVMAYGGSVLAFQIGAGVLVGFALGAVGFSVVLGAVARATPPDKRSSRLGIASAGGSFGMFAMVPIGQSLIDGLGWQGALTALALVALSLLALALPLGGAGAKGTQAAAPVPAGPVSEGPGLRETVAAALRHDGFWLLTAGFFVCGFHVAFIAVHLPGFVASCGLSAEVGTWALALVGLFNVGGSLLAGHLGGRYRPKGLLAGIYALRALVILALLLSPKTPLVLLVFAAAMGVLWLSTVPLTTGIVAGIFGPRYVSTLFGLVFLSHQVGAFLGALSGGLSVRWTGGYDAVWWISLALALMAAIVHLPIRDARLPAYAAA